MLKTYTGSCHCGKIRFEIDAEIDHVRVCDCSVCSRRGALIFRVEEDCFRLLSPDINQLSLYQWGTKTAKDYFCPTCGILPFRRPSALTKEEIAKGMKPFSGWAINTRCLENFDLENVPKKQIQGSAL